MIIDSEVGFQKIGTTIQESVPYRMFSLTTVVTFLIAIGLITLSLAVFTLFDGYAVTFASFVTACYCLYVVNHIRVNHIIVYGLVISFLVINAAIHVLWLDGMEFLKSFMLTAVMLFVYITSLVPRDALRKRIDYASALKVARYAIVGFLLVQVAEQLFFGSTTSWFWLDGASISNAVDIYRFEAVNALGIFRPVSFFHEPSYLAAVIFIMLVINDHLFPGGKVRYILIGSIVLTLSALMLGVLLAYLAIDLWCRNKALFLVGALMVLVFVLVFPEHVWEFSRLGEIFIEGSSGYIRVVDPLMHIKAILSKFPFGIPLGQSEVVFDTSLFLIPLYFGLFAPFLILIWVFVILQRLGRIKYVVKYFLGVSSLLLVNGSIFTIESAFLLLILNYAFMPVKK